MRFLSLIIALLFLPACKTVKPVTPPANPTVLAPVVVAVDEAAQAAAAAAKAQAERDSKLVASMEVVDRQNKAAPKSPQQIIIEAEITFSLRLLGSVAVSPEDRAAAAERETLFAQGRADEARKLYADASAKADALNAQIAAANAQRDAALARASEEITKAAQALAAQQAKHLADMEKLQTAHRQDLADARSEVLRDQVAWFNRIGAGCEAAALLIVAGCFFFGGLVALRKFGPIALFLGVAGLLCFGMAQIVGLPWFKWACLAAVLIVVVWVGVFLYRHYKQGDLKAEVETRAAKIKGVLGDVVGGVEDVRKALKETGSITKERANEILREWITETDGTAAAVDEVRREKGLL